MKPLFLLAFATLKVNTIDGQVMSKNFMALSLHERFGFKLKERNFLKKVVRESSISFEICEENIATEKFFLDVVEVSRAEFTKATQSSNG